VRRLRRAVDELGDTPADECRKSRLWRDIGWLQWLYEGNRKGAARAFLRADSLSATSGKRAADTWSLLGRALLSETAYDRQRALERYLDTAEAAAEPFRPGPSGCELDPPVTSSRCKVALLAAHKIGSLLDEDVRAARDVKRLEVLASRMTCAEATLAIHRILMDLARRRGDGDELDRLARASGCPEKRGVSPRFGRYGELDLMLQRPVPSLSRWSRFGGKASGRCKIPMFSESGLEGIKEVRLRFRVEREGDSVVWVGAGGRNFAVAVDGEVVSGPAGPSEWRGSRVAIDVHLDEGVHELAVRAPVSLGRYGLEVRVTDRNGRRPSITYLDPITKSQRSTSWADDGRSGDEVVRAGSGKSRRGFAPLSAYLRGWQWLVAGRVDRGQLSIERLLGGAPNFVPGRLLAASMALAWPMGDGTTARDRAASHLSAAFRVDERAHLALARRLELARRADRYEEALSLVNQGIRRKNAEIWWRYRARLLQDKRWLTLADLASLKAVRLKPNSREAWRVRLSVAHQRSDLSTVRTASARLARLDKSSDAWASLLLRRDRAKEAVSEYERLRALAPASRHLRESLAKALAATGRYEQAASAYRRLLATEQWNPDVRLDLVRVLLEHRRRDEAVAVLEQGRSLRPGSLEIRKALGGLAKKGPFEGFRVDTMEVIEDYRAKGVPEGAGKEAVFVLDRTVDRVFSTGALLELTHQIVHLRSNADLKRWGHVTVPDGVEVLEVRTIKNDLSFREPEEPSGGEPINLPNLEVGDFVELETTVSKPPLAVLGGGFMGQRFYFQSAQGAMHRSEYVLVTPPDMKVTIDARGGSPTPSVEHRERLTIREWRSDRSPRFEKEPHSPPAVAFIPSVRAAAGVSWKRLARLVSEKLLPLDRPSGEMRMVAKRLCEGRGAEQAARAIYRWVNGGIEQSGTLYGSARSVMARRSGYRLTLMRSLLRLCEVDVSTIMVEPTHRHVERGPVADIASYRYPVLQVAPKGWASKERFYLFPFMRSIPFGMLPAMLRGARAIRVTGGPVEFVKTPADAGRDLRSVSMDVQLQKDGSARIKVVEKLEGWPAVLWRRNLERMSRRRVVQLFQRGRLAPHFPGAELEGELRISALNKPAEPLVLRYELTVPGLARRNQGRLVIRRSFFPQNLASTYLTRPDRKTTLLFGAHPELRLDIRLDLPEGYRAEMVSPDSKISGKWGEVIRKVDRMESSKGKRGSTKPPAGVRVRIVRKLPYSRVAVSEYKELGEFVRSADQTEQIVVVLKAK
jgi:tetratricopeptide (TPR) repeat protein